MTAIVGCYIPPTKHCADLTFWWLYCSHWLSHEGRRRKLAQELSFIRSGHGRHEAREFRNYLLWLGVYPSRVLKPHHVLGESP
jgi:hypothetical protein